MAFYQSLRGTLKELPPFLVYTFQNYMGFKILGFTLLAFVAFKAFRRFQLHKKRNSYPRDKVILHQFPRTHNYKLPSVSPFCLKLETWLRIAKIDYQNDFGYTLSSKGKIPWITYQNIDVADSGFCIDFLSSTFNISLAKDADDKEKGAARAILKMCEDSIYPCIALYRFKYYPMPIQSGFPKIILRLLGPKIINYYKIQGYGNHTKDEVLSIARKDFKAINDFLGDKKYITGDQISNEDAGLFGVLAQAIYQDCGLITEYAKKECPNVIRYVDTMKNTFWPDWNEHITNTPIRSVAFLKSYIYYKLFV